MGRDEDVLAKVDGYGVVDFIGIRSRFWWRSGLRTHEVPAKDDVMLDD